MIAVTKQDKQWQTESDARTIRNYADLTADKERFGRATDFLNEEKAKLTALLLANQPYVDLSAASRRKS